MCAKRALSGPQENVGAGPDAAMPDGVTNRHPADEARTSGEPSPAPATPFAWMDAIYDVQGGSLYWH